MTPVSIVVMILCIGCIWGGLIMYLVKLLKAQKESQE